MKSLSIKVINKLITSFTDCDDKVNTCMNRQTNSYRQEYISS